MTREAIGVRIAQAISEWLMRSPSHFTRSGYARELRQFLGFAGIAPDRLDELRQVRPADIAAWRDSLLDAGQANASVRRKLTVLRSLYSFLQLYGLAKANPAHGKLVQAPAVSRDGKTVGLAPADCRSILNAPDPATPVGVRDRALFAVLAYTGCRVGELVRLKVGDYQSSGGHRILRIFGKGGRERTVPLHPEAFERLDVWIQAAGIQGDLSAFLFRAVQTARGQGRDGFRRDPLTRRGVEFLVTRYVRRLKLDPGVTVHSFRVTALTTARERGADILDLQFFAGHSDPRTTLAYIRTWDRLSKSPAYVLAY